jgi:hypothetical protein
MRFVARNIAMSIVSSSYDTEVLIIRSAHLRFGDTVDGRTVNSAPVATTPFSCFPDRTDTVKVRQKRDEESRVRIHTYWRLDLDFHQSRFYGSGKMPR